MATSGGSASPSRWRLEVDCCCWMNPEETRGLMSVITRIRDRGVTVFLIEHHMQLVMGLCDRVVVLSQGKKLVEGPPAEVSRNAQVIEAYLGQEVPLA
jgi:branched-chain amino acid transport system ATP-binding protein